MIRKLRFFKVYLCVYCFRSIAWDASAQLWKCYLGTLSNFASINCGVSSSKWGAFYLVEWDEPVVVGMVWVDIRRVALGFHGARVSHPFRPEAWWHVRDCAHPNSDARGCQRDCERSWSLNDDNPSVVRIRVVCGRFGLSSGACAGGTYLHRDGVDCCYRLMGTGHTRGTVVVMVSAIAMPNQSRVEATIHATYIYPMLLFNVPFTC